MNPRFCAVFKFKGGYVEVGPKTAKAEIADLGFHP